MSTIDYSRFDGIGDTSSDDSDDGRDQRREGKEVSRFDIQLWWKASQQLPACDSQSMS